MFVKFSEQGYVPIPIYRNGKNPTIGNWQKYCKERPIENLLQYWDNQFKEDKINIGITCGEASGIIALDIDTDDPNVLNQCPRSIVSRRGSKGEVRFFKYNPKIESRSYPGLDILSDGRQVLIPPSIHPDTKKPYKWLTPDTLMDIKPSDLPELDYVQLQNVLPLLIKANPIKASGRNNKLKDIVTSMRCRNENESDIVQEVYRWDMEHHNPPLFSDKAEGFEAKNKEEAFSNAYLFVTRITKTLIEQGVLKPQYEDNKVVVTIDDSELAKSNKFKSKPYPKANGIMGLFQEICEARSNGNQDALSLGGAIAMMGAVCSNRVVTVANGFITTPNMYVINLAPSSFGKETCQTLIEDLLCHTGLLGSASYKSGTAIVMSLPKQQERIDIIDECSSLLRSMTSREDYKTEIVEILSLIYSKAKSTFFGFSSVGNGDRFGACHNPHVSILGSTTPIGFKTSVNKEMAAKGLIPRFLLFYQEELGAYRGRKKRRNTDKDFAMVKEGIDLILKHFPKVQDPNWIPEKGDLMNGKGTEGAKNPMGIKYTQKVIPFTKDGLETWINFDEKCFDLKKDNPDSFDSAFIGRFSEIVTKLALLDTMAQMKPSIDELSVEWAIKVVETQWHNAISLYEVASAENREESEMLRVLNIIKKATSITRSELTEKTRWLGSGKKRNEILKTLQESGDIESVFLQKNGATKKTEIFRISLTK